MKKETADQLLKSLKELLPYAKRDVARLNEMMVGNLYPSITLAMLDRAEDTIERAKKEDEAEATALLIAAAPDLLEACKAQHDALDTLFAMLIATKPDFFPSKSESPWEALLKGNAAIAKATGGKS